MKRMTTIRKIFTCIALISIFASTSCKKFLEPKAVSFFDEGYVFDNVQNARAAVLGAYLSMAGDFGYGIRLSAYFPYDTDEGVRGRSATTSDEGQLLAHYLGIPSNLQITNPFNQLYQGVERANMCIYGIPRMSEYTNGSGKQMAQLRRLHGEALVLRAQFLYELCRNWGDVPVQWQPSALETTQYKGRTSTDEIYSHLIDDLALAASLMPWRTEVTSIGDAVDQRFTKGTAKALRAKIALTRGGYSLRQSGALQRSADYLTYYKIARDECYELIQNRSQHNLIPSYTSLFKDYLLAHNLNDPYGEVMMWAAMASSGSGSTTDSKLGLQNGTKMNGVGGGSTLVLPTYFYMFDSTDRRRDMTCVPYEIAFDTIKTGHAATDIYDGKFRREWVTNPGFVFSNGNPSVSFRPATNTSLQNMQLSWPMIRFSDVLLWFAEADNELMNGPTSEAMAAITEVNLRGHGGSYTETPPVFPADKDGFFKALVKERMLEFGGEGIRKYDLIRWNLLATAIAETRQRLTDWANSTNSSHVGFTPYTYMEDGPVYTRDASELPSYLYYSATPTRSNIYDFNPFLNSFYQPSQPIAGQKRVNWWIGGTVPAGYANAFAGGFQTGKSELLPLPQTQRDVNFNLSPQNPGY